MRALIIIAVSCTGLVGAWLPTPCQKPEDCGKYGVCRNQRCVYLRMGPILPAATYCNNNIVCPTGFKCHNRKCKKKYLVPTSRTLSTSTTVPTSYSGFRHPCYCIVDFECMGGKCFVGRCLKF